MQLLQKAVKLKRITLVALIMAGASAPAAGQLALPGPPAVVGQALGQLDQALDPALDAVKRVDATAQDLLRERTLRIERLVRRNRDSIELGRDGEPARKGELLLVDPGAEALGVARDAGFTILGTDNLDGLGISVTRLAVPAGMSLAKAQRQLGELLPGETVATDSLNFASGRVRGGGSTSAPTVLLPPVAAPVGMIDGAPQSATEVRGFARGAPKANDHGSAIASLLRLAGVQRIHAADVYGDDRAGGNALAVARALDWLVGDGVRVISVSLVGPANPLLEKAIAGAQRRGAVIVAAVGNDGPASPPGYPASYPGVIAVTGVDGRNRALIEAGRALHLDYAAPAADMMAANAGGRWVRVRGTSFAAPLVAARAAAAMGGNGGGIVGGNVIVQLDREAIDIGAKGRDPLFGRGLICTICRRTE